MAQRFSTLVHAAKNDLNAVWRAQAPDPTMLILALDVAWLILVPARPAPGLLHGGESPGVGEPQPGPGTLEPPEGAERRRERSEGALCDFCLELNLSKLRLPDQCREGAWKEKVLEEFGRHWKVMRLVNTCRQPSTPLLLPDLRSCPHEDSPATQQPR